MARARTTWVKGQSGNPSGARAHIPIPKEVRDAAKSFAPEAIETLAKLMGDKKQPGAVRLHAAEAILARGYGKPREMVEISGSLDLVGLLANLTRQEDNMKTIEHERAIGHDAHTVLAEQGNRHDVNA